jgi:hypothetical protein
MPPTNAKQDINLLTCMSKFNEVRVNDALCVNLHLYILQFWLIKLETLKV